MRPSTQHDTDCLGIPATRISLPMGMLTLSTCPAHLQRPPPVLIQLYAPRRHAAVHRPRPLGAILYSMGCICTQVQQKQEKSTNAHYHYINVEFQGSQA